MKFIGASYLCIYWSSVPTETSCPFRLSLSLITYSTFTDRPVWWWPLSTGDRLRFRFLIIHKRDPAPNSSSCVCVCVHSGWASTCDLISSFQYKAIIDALGPRHQVLRSRFPISANIDTHKMAASMATATTQPYSYIRLNNKSNCTHLATSVYWWTVCTHIDTARLYTDMWSESIYHQSDRRIYSGYSKRFQYKLLTTRSEV